MKKIAILLGLLILHMIASGQPVKKVSDELVLVTMKKASAYMANEVSCHGGYLWYYKEDLSEVFGEVPARKSQIWVQGTGTPAMGHIFLDMYEATGDEEYLGYAKKAASALIFGQHPMGGWHYFIDFDKKGLEGWYRDTASQFIIGWEEYRYYYGNCTYDDNVTQGATKFLISLYKATLEPVYLAPLLKALNFILISQYPNGGWPQRYPLRYDFAHDGLPDYTSYYTLNDGAMNNTIDVLLEAYELLGDERYLMAAKRGADFFMLVQGPEGQAGWTDQFDMDLQPTAARTHEPASFQVRYTLSTIHQLEKMFLYTGDRRYLRPIPMALDWIESSVLKIDDRGRPEFAKWYEPVSNYPITMDYLNEFTAEGYMRYKYTVDSSVNFVKLPGKSSYREQYELIRDVEPGKEREMYENLNQRSRRNSTVDEQKITDLINSVNENGIWIESFTVHDISRTMVPNYKSVVKNGSYLYAVKELEGISTQTYMRNMLLLMDFLNRSNEYKSEFKEMNDE
ncbi:MAG: pectate lyase [Bacteroidota bacterium]